MKKYCKVDSCKLSIPLNQCEVIDQSLLDHFEDIRLNVNTGTMEKIKEYLGKPYQLTFKDGTSVKIWIEKQVSYNSVSQSKTNEDYITFLANSKHLGPLYFNGITVDTLEHLYNYVMSLEVFKCSFTSFKKARYSDVDVCFDFKCSDEEFEILKSNIKKSAIDPSYFHTVDTKDNSGIWTPTKKDPRKQATPGKPFIKFYSKEKDFTFNSNKFARSYFKPIDYKDLIRFECTIKNAQHKRELGLNEIPTFIEFLKSDLQLLSSNIFSRYFERLKTTRISGTMTPHEKLLIGLINRMIEAGIPKTEIIKEFNRKDVSPKARQRLVKKYQKLYRTDKVNKAKLEANQVSESVFQFLNIDADNNV